jgi:uncharacterized protein
VTVPMSSSVFDHPHDRRTILGAGSLVGLAVAAGADGMAGVAAQGTPETTDNPNVALIGRFYEAYALGDPEALRPFLAASIVWRIPGHHPLSGEKRGADEVLAFFAQLAKSGFGAATIVLAADADWVIDLHRGFSTRGEGALDIVFALAIRIANDQIVEAINFAFDQAAADVYFWANYPLKPIPDRLA